MYGMMGIMETESVFSKYSIINDDWELHKNPDDVGIKELWGVSLGSEMMAHCLDIDGVKNEIKSEITKFNNIYEYYVRHLMVGRAFISYPSNGNMTSKTRDNIFKSYNIDPWNRQFPYFIDNVASSYYNSLDGSSGVKIRYGYWVFYKDRIITGTDQAFKLDRISSYLLDNEPPLMILTTTSLDGITVACLDFVER
jgi:hypothetical protein